MVRTLRAARLNDARFTRTGLTSADADASVADLLTFLAEPRSNAELDAFFAERFPDLPETGVWWALRSYAPLIHAPGPHPWTYGHRPAYLAAPAPAAGERDRSEADAAMVELARRYLAAYGPATPADLAQFSTLYRPPAKQAFADLTDELVAAHRPGRQADLRPGRGGRRRRGHSRSRRGCWACGTTRCWPTPTGAG